MKQCIQLLFILTLSCSWGQDYTPSIHAGTYVEHAYYSLSYVEAHEQAEWVYYQLTYPMIHNETRRTDDFRSDPRVETGSAELSDYKGSGFDRGHLAPAADMRLSATSMSESFYFSNMSPQQPSFNRGKWKILEEQVRAWVGENEPLYVVTGPVFKDNQGAIGENEVTIPGYYYKVLFRPSDSTMIAFVLPNQKLEDSIGQFACTVDHVEELTGIDFFPQLDDPLEESLESNLHIAEWLNE